MSLKPFMKKDRSKPLVLYVAERIYKDVNKIKKNNPNFTLIEAIEMFSTTKEYINISSGNFHESLFKELKKNNFVNKETNLQVSKEVIELLKVQQDTLMRDLNFSRNTYFAKSSFPLSNTQKSFDLLWRICESYELWCKETKQLKLIYLGLID